MSLDVGFAILLDLLGAEGVGGAGEQGAGAGGATAMGVTEVAG